MAKAFIALTLCLCACTPGANTEQVQPKATATQPEAVAAVQAEGATQPKAAAAPQPKGAATRAKTAATQPKPVKPAWSELTPAQQQVLAPLQEDWTSFDATRRKKWVTIANRYPKMKADEQERLQARMKEWSNLTPEQRRLAREKYLAIRKMPPEKRQELRNQWEEYQASLAARTPDDHPPGEPPSSPQ